MGACSIVISATGKSMQNAFRNAQEEAREEYGNDSYNGQINNCELDGDVTHKRGEFKEDDFFHDWILDNTNKRDVKGYCVREPKGNKNKTKSVVTNYPQKGTRKWSTWYLIHNSWTDEILGGDASQTEAIKKARAYVEKHPNINIDVRITKKLDEGQIKVADVKYKKASDEREGLYTFIGWAPE